MNRRSIPRSVKYILPAVAIGLMSACDSNDTKVTEADPVSNPKPADPSPTEISGGARILIAKPGAPDHVLVFDLEEKAEIASVQVGGKISALHASPGYRYAIVAQSESGTINFLDSGIEYEDHGDHGHLHLGEPGMLDLTLSGTKPAHITKNQDRMVIFFDGVEGVPAEVRVLSETTISEGKVLAAYSDDIHQHGAAQAWDDFLISTVRDPNLAPPTTLPSMVKISERDGDHFHELDLLDDPEYSCPGLHGSAQSAAFISFGCIDGVLVLGQHDDHFDAYKLPSDTRISSLFGHPNVIDIVGAGKNSDDDPVSIFAINPAAETITAIEYEGTPRAYSFARDGEIFLILDTEGGLTALNTADWARAGPRMQVTAASEVEEQIFRLTVSADGTQAYVADAGARKILAVDVDDWSLDDSATIDLDFVPGPILWLGTL